MIPDDATLQAEFIKALANPVRLSLLSFLESGSKTASELVTLSGLSKANLSQHINLMKKEGLVNCDKQGRFCYYSIADTRLLQAVNLLIAIRRERAR